MDSFNAASVFAENPSAAFVERTKLGVDYKESAV
jgi:hypothetical protein